MEDFFIVLIIIFVVVIFISIFVFLGINYNAYRKYAIFKRFLMYCYHDNIKFNFINYDNFDSSEIDKFIDKTEKL